MASREYACIVIESSYGTPKTSPATGTDRFYLRLDGANAFSMQAQPIIGDIMYGGGRATPALAFSDQTECRGRLTGNLYGSNSGAFAKLLLDWGLTVINSGRTTPWTTTDASYLMPVGDLASCSIYHAKQLNTGAYDLRRYSGVKVLGGSLESSRQSPLVRISLDLQGVRDDTNAANSVAYPDATEFPAPAETDYPTTPFLFSHTAGGYKIGSTRTQYDSVSIRWQNAMDPKWFESKYITLIKFCGRTSSFSAKLHMKASPDDLAAFQALTVQDSEISFANGSNTIKLDFLGSNYIKTLGRDLPLNQVYSWDLMAQNYWNAATPGDIVVTLT
jgi:hypothetical protein